MKQKFILRYMAELALLAALLLIMSLVAVNGFAEPYPVRSWDRSLQGSTNTLHRNEAQTI